MTWLGLAVARHRTPGARGRWWAPGHAARLQGAISGSNEPAVIDADMLARCREVFVVSRFQRAADLSNPFGMFNLNKPGD